METEELIRKCRAITLEEEEEDKVSFAGKMKARGTITAEGCLLGKILITRGVNKEGLRVAMQQVWRTVREVKIENLGDNIFMFKFALEADKKRVLAGGPWHFDRALIVLTEPKGIESITAQTFTHTSFWIHLRNLPVMCMNGDAVEDLGAVIGKVKEVETDENGDCIGKYARARISVDITKPLKKVIFLEQEGENEIPIPVLYERLSDFCFCCGKLGHQYRECGKYKGQAKEDLPFGSWLKAITFSDRFKQNKNRERWNQHNGRKTENFTSQNQNDKAQNPQKEGNRQEETGAELTQMKAGGYIEPIDDDHVAEGGH